MINNQELEVNSIIVNNTNSVELRAEFAGDNSVENNSENAAEDFVSCEEPIRAQVFSLLFISNRPLSASKIADTTKKDLEDIVEVLSQIKEDLASYRMGIQLVQIDDSFQLRTIPEVAPVLKRVVGQRTKRLSRQAAETLALIAYKQPIQKSEIENIRGVDALPTIKTLMDLKLVRIIGRDSSVGNPPLYGTTEYFLDRFGLKDLSELMTLKEINIFEEDPGEPESEAADEVEQETPLEAYQEDLNQDANKQ